jgi:hypothetical protein
MQQFRPGFRLSVFDAVILAIGIASTFLAPKEFAIISITAVGHFFLFCNVFRISRAPELIWAGVFVILCSCTLALGYPNWITTIGLAIAVATALIVRELFVPSYHGIFWRKFNPDLPVWWKKRNEK